MHPMCAVAVLLPVALLSAPAPAQVAAPQPPQPLTLPSATRVYRPPEVDPDTGRPVESGGRPDIVDARARARQRQDARRGQGRGEVAAYLLLPDPALAVEAGRSRTADRALQARALPGVTVRSRRRPAYDAVGVRAGGILFRPYLSAGVAYDGNVYAEENARSDLFGYTQAGVAGASEWGRHRLTLRGVVARRENARYTTENNTTYDLNAAGRYDVDARVSLTAEVQQQRVQLARSSVEEVTRLALPTVYTLTSSEFGAHLDRGRIQANLIGGVLHQRFRDNRALDGSLTDQSFRNYRGYSGQIDVAHEVFGNRALYGQIDFERRRFDTLLGQQRNNADVSDLLIGMRGPLTKLIRGHVAIGLIHVDYQDPAAQTRNGYNIDAQLDWLFRERTTLSFSAKRELRSVSQIDARSALFTVLTASVDHEVRRNLILTVGARQQWTNYVDDERRASSTGLSLSADWLVDRHWAVRPQFSFITRTDRGFTIDLGTTDPQATLALTYRL